MLMSVIVLALSLAVIYFYLVGETWRRHTVSANRRRKRVEAELRQTVGHRVAVCKENEVLYRIIGDKSRLISRMGAESTALVKECRETREVLTERVVALQAQVKIATDLARATETSLSRSREAYTIANAAAIQNEWYRQICERIEVLPEVTNASERYRLTRRNVEGKWVPIRKPRLRTIAVDVETTTNEATR